MAPRYQGGRIPLIGVPATAFTNVAQQAVVQAVPNTFVPYVGSSLNGIVGGATGAALNIGLAGILGDEVARQAGVDLFAGQNFLDSQITPFITNTLGNAVSTSIQDSLRNAGPLGPIVGDLAGNIVTGLASSLGNSLGLNIPGAGNGPSLTAPSQPYPGAGGEGEKTANYGGSTYNLGTGGPDVVFSIVPANSGPQLFGLGQAAFDPKTDFSVATNVYTDADLGLSFVPRGEELTKLTSQFGANAFNLDTESINSFAFSPNAPNLFNDLGLTNPFPQQAWNFIVAPEDISWNTSASVSRVPIFGSNQPPVTVGAKGMRDLTFSNAMVEGFTRSIAIEDKVAILEDLLNYSLDTGKGYVNIPIYNVTANSKHYGNGKDSYDRGYFVINEVRVKEAMRDLDGNATRAFVDISFTQIPPYQVDGGRDQATNTIDSAANASYLQQINQRAEANLNQNRGTGSGSTVPGAKPPGSSTGTPSQTPSPPAPPPPRDPQQYQPIR